MVAFDIGNTGDDASSTSILVTPTYMQAVRVELVDVGSDGANIETKHFRSFPLVSSTAFEKIVTVNRNKDFLRQRLFPKGEPQPCVPKGLEHLSLLLHAPEEVLGRIFLDKSNGNANAIFQQFEPSPTSEVFKDHASVEKLIGSGRHGHVYSLCDRDRCCLKASRAGETYRIEGELIVLQRLANYDGSKTPYQIPRLLKMGRLQLNIRKSSASFPAFLFEPRGMPALDLMEKEK